MNYQDNYDQLIYLAKNRSKPECYTEKHHIIPKAFGGSDDENNIAILTASEHFIAHYYLYKIHHGKMMYAFLRMYNQNKDTIEESLIFEYANEYQIIKEEWIQTLIGREVSQETKNKLSKSHKGLIPHNKGKPHSEETKRKISEKLKNNKPSEESIRKGLETKRLNREKIPKSERIKHRRKPLSEEQKQKISKANKGRNLGKVLSEEHRKIISQTHKGVTRSESAKKKQSEKLKGRVSPTKGMKWKINIETGKKEYYNLA